MNNENLDKELKYVIYARRSIEKRREDELVESTEDQLRVMKKIALDLDFKVVKLFSEEKSAAKPGNRTVFTEMIEFIEAGKANAILCWDYDRLARNPKENGVISQLQLDGKIQLIKTPSREYRTADNLVMGAVEGAMSAEYIRKLRANIKRGQEGAATRGFRPTLAPIGYVNTKFREKGVPEMCLVDEKTFPLLRKMFDMVLSREYTPSQVYEIATKQWGLHARKSRRYPNGKHLSNHSFYDILSNPFYYGRFQYPEGSKKWYDGKHTPLITEAEFNEVQVILGKGSAKHQKHDHAYMGLMRCPCGARITCHKRFKTQMNGNQHTYSYYRCTGHKGPCPNKSMARLEKLEEAFIEFLSSLQIGSKFHEWAMAELRREYERESDDKTSILYTQEKLYKNTQDKIKRLFQMRLDGDVSSEEYQQEKDVLEKEERRLKVEIDAVDSRFKTWINDAERLLTFAERAKEEFINGDTQKRRSIISALGTEHILYNGVLTIQAEKPLLLMREMASAENLNDDSFKPLNDIGTKGSFDENDPSDSLRWRWGR